MTSCVGSVIAVSAFWFRSVRYGFKICIGATPCTRNMEKVAEGIRMIKPISFVHWFSGIVATVNKTPVAA